MHAALFSGVVATFVVTTASALTPDNTQIIAALLVENNQLLRAAGNNTRVNAVPAATLAPGSSTHSTIDIWVNGLFFASLASSLLTALAAVLIKQWLQVRKTLSSSQFGSDTRVPQSYTLLVSGSAKDRALVSHYRFRGFINWHLPTVVECLPLVLHISLALFLVGFALYAFQLARPICWAIVSISGIASVFYTGSFVLSAVFIDCPYRIPFVWSISQYTIYPFYLVKQSLKFLWLWLRYRKFPSLEDADWPAFPKSTRQMVEYRAVFPLVPGKSLKRTFFAANEIICDALSWAFNHASNQSAKDVIVEAVTGLLHDWTALLQNLVFETHQVSELDFESVKGKILQHDLFPTAVDYSLKKLIKPNSEAVKNQDTLDQTPCAQLLDALLTTTTTDSSSDKASYMDLPLVHTKRDWRRKVQGKLDRAYRAAALKGDHILGRKLLQWGAGILPMSGLPSEMPLLHAVALNGDVQSITDILDRQPAYIHRVDRLGYSALHVAALHGKLDAVTALVERGASLDTLSDRAHAPMTPVNLALQNDHPDVVAYLLDHNASSPVWALHEAAKLRDTQMARVLLERGWSKWEKNAQGQTPVDVAVAFDNLETARFLEGYAPAS
ncbi:hypothetical protein C0992_011846 [Termitomyces sp. T32_za158]|nr:hypothetical protein C0992_011846 [Termitomyces sp. T32_za158]